MARGAATLASSLYDEMLSMPVRGRAWTEILHAILYSSRDGRARWAPEDSDGG